MTRDEAKQEIIERWEEIMTHLTHPAKAKANHRTSYVCPLCGHGENGDGLTINPKGKKGSLKCFGGSCKFSGDIIDLYMKVAGVDFKEALDVLADQLNLQIDENPVPKKEEKAVKEESQNSEEKEQDKDEPQDYTEYYKECLQRLETDPAGLSYLLARGIHGDMARRFWLGYDPAWKSPTAIRKGNNPPATPRLIIPINKSHYEARDIRPDHQEKPASGPDFRKMKEGSSATFNVKALYAQDVQEVFITEGAIDAISIYEAGGQAVGIASANRAQAFIDELIVAAANGKKLPPIFIICLDNDKDGKEATRRISKGLQQLDIPFITADICGEYKDPNERLQKDRQGLINAIRKAKEDARQYQQDSGETDINDFFDIVSTERYKAIPTGIEALDRRLSGGLVNQWLVIINAAPGAGKTVLATQILENMARAGRKCLYFNFEMSKDQLIARSLARIIGDENIGALDILRLYKQDEETQRRVFNAGVYYKRNIAPNMLYNPDGASPKLHDILNTMRVRAKRAEDKGEPAPIICIDYLQIIKGKEKEDIKETIKDAVYSFKKFAEEHNTIVLCISAQSRSANNDAEARQDAGRDTSNIEYSADLQLQIKDNPDEEGHRLLFITKSRFVAPSLKHSLDFIFNGKQGRFIFDKEVGNDGKKGGAARRKH